MFIANLFLFLPHTLTNHSSLFYCYSLTSPRHAQVRKFSLAEMNSVVGNSHYYKSCVKGNPAAQHEVWKQRTAIRDLIKLNRYINLDFVNKRLSLQNGEGKYSKTFGQKEREGDQHLLVDTDSLLDRPTYDDPNKGRGLKSRRGLRMHLTDSNPDVSADAGGILDASEHGKQLLKTGGLNKSFRHFDDGFGGISSKDHFSHSRMQSNVWSPIRRAVGRTKAYLMGTVYVPSEGDAWRETRRYKNPHTVEHTHLLKDASWHATDAVPHHIRSSQNNSQNSGSISNNNDDSCGAEGEGDVELGSSSSSSSKGGAAGAGKMELTQVERERSEARKAKRRALRQTLKNAQADSNGGEIGGADAASGSGAPSGGAGVGEHGALREGHGHGVFTTDKPNPDAVVQHSIKFVSRDNAHDILKEVVGNDAHLDSDGFSDDSDVTVDSDLEDLQSLMSSKKVSTDSASASAAAAEEEEGDYFDTAAGKDSRADRTLLERGLETETSGAVSGMHEEQAGKLLGVDSVDSAHSRYYAGSGLGSRNVIRRLQSDGMRLDSEMHDNNDKSKTSTAVATATAVDAVNKSGKKAAADEKTKARAVATLHAHKLWKPLDNRRDVEMYDMAIASDISKRAHLLPGALAASKVRFLMLEAFGDLMGHKALSFEFFASVTTLLFSWWLRIYIHYLSQYLYLGAIGVPVYGFEMQPFQLRYKYMSSAMQQVYEIALICIGPAANIVVFLVMLLVGHLFTTIAGNLPDGLSTFMSAYGLMTLLDPVMVLLVDLFQGNYNCDSSSAACAADYTATACTCFTGDWVKLYDRLNAEAGGGGGITGVLITVIIYFSFAIVAALVYYVYLVRVHRNGRILDLWRRVHSLAQEFFIPDDFELSREELVHICTKAGLWRGGGGDIRRVTVTKLIEKDAEDVDFYALTKLYAIHEMNMDGENKRLYRQFLLMPDGYIIEVFSDFKINDKFVPTTEKEKQLLIMENWNAKQDSSGTGAGAVVHGKGKAAVLTTAQRTKKGLFKGLEKA